MANILIAGVKIPFTSGGQEALVGSLKAALRARGHNVDVVEIPFSVLPKEEIPTQCAIWKAYDFTRCGGETVDLLIATKFPSYYASHPRKSIWLVHQHRALYDLFGTRFSDFSDDPRDEALRQMLVDGDVRAIREARYVAGISKNVVTRLKNFCGIDAVPLYPPLPLGNRYVTADSDQYVLSVGRICSIKRIDLMIKALPIVHPFVKLKIAGIADEPGVMEYLHNEISKHHLWGRVEFLGRVSDDALLSLYANAAVVYYAPYNEDYGYVTLEAFASSKPVVTGADSGGTLEFVTHERNGLIVAPTSDAIGHAVNRLIEDRPFAEKLGATGRSDLETLGLHERGWDEVVDGLLSPLREPPGGGR